MGVIVGIATILVLLLICAFAFTLSDFDESVAQPMSNICLSFGAICSGLVSSSLHKSKGLIIGLVDGAVLFIIITLISLFISGGTITINTPLRLVVMPLLGAVGGVIGVNHSAKRKMI